MINVRFIKYLSTPFYADEGISFLDLRFENDVKMYGTQARYYLFIYVSWFENDVKMYGTQAIEIFGAESAGFENDVWYSSSVIPLEKMKFV